MHDCLLNLVTGQQALNLALDNWGIGLPFGCMRLSGHAITTRQAFESIGALLEAQAGEPLARLDILVPLLVLVLCGSYACVGNRSRVEAEQLQAG